MPGYNVIPSLRFADLAGAVSFYTGTLGFQLVRGGPDQDNSSIARGDAHLMVEKAAAYYSPEYNAAIKSRLRGTSPNALYIEAEDLRDLYASAQAKGARIIDPIAPREWGQTEFTVEDPEGNWLTFWKKED
ncbi:MAG: VOC family protein [Dehalococcoidia bacterium]